MAPDAANGKHPAPPSPTCTAMADGSMGGSSRTDLPGHALHRPIPSFGKAREDACDNRMANGCVSVKIGAGWDRIATLRRYLPLGRARAAEANGFSSALDPASAAS
ncbi:hypothetical protein [Mesorhizobium sp. STM 4661]|uniref:hypothetical protein n=1 Tax=Mesorhizobium sp. STM 4661 TaxID=1297570 RepID=UPI0002C01E35|nr:hypothetical protein [Mesorhizobium sp. STM 4661]CCV16342.1 conserved hypothetical protein [Mesorhizobium sp. STM 4661]